jgi:glycosyltransferase involved in cell wall biosynthesis
MTLITPSKWLAELVKESYLREYDVEVVYNTIDTSVFKPTESDFRVKNSLENKKIVLGVASTWDKYKGLYDFYKLRELLDDNYAIILVGLNDKQLSELPEGIIGIKRTNSREELAAIYTSADVFVNPTYEDTYPTVNLEAQACGTPVITYRTGGSPESVPAENVVDVGDINQLAEKIMKL